MTHTPELTNLGEFKVHIDVAGAAVTATVGFPEVRTQEPQLEYAFYLMRDQVPVWRGRYSNSPEATFLIPSEGTYAVKTFVRVGSSKRSRTSESFTIPAKAVVAVNSDSSKMTEDLPFTPLDYPHKDFALISFPGQTNGYESLDRRVQELGMSTQEWSTSAEPIYAVSPSPSEANAVLFSGMTRTKDSFVYGQQDVCQIRPIDYLDNVGDFTIAIRYPWGADISTDYFGVGKIYYYSSTRVTCVSNRYHLLLLLLTGVGEPLEIDPIKARATLQAVNQPFTQNFSTEMEIAGCKTLRPGSKLRMIGPRLELDQTGIARVISEPTNQRFSAEDYARKLRCAGEEIVDNLRLALLHPKFKHVRVDLTGGLDARLLFTALAQLEDYKEKVHIHTADVAGSPRDLDVSLALTREAGMEYDTIPRATEPMASTDSVLENLSYHLGTYYGIRPESRRANLPETLRINGFYAEACARPYFSRLIFGRNTEAESPGDFSRSYIKGIGDEELPLTRRAEIMALFRREFEALPGHSAADKMEMFYLVYRNGLHCSDRWLNHTLAPGWGPLQSKEVFALKWKTLNTFKSIKVQVDLTEYLDAELAQLPIGRQQDNADRHALDSKYPSQHADLAEELALSDRDYARYRRAEKIRGQKLRRAAKPNAQALEVQNEVFEKEYEKSILSAITRLEEDFEVLSRQEAETLAQYVHNHVLGEQRPKQRGVVIANKILSTYHQCRLASSQ